MEEPPCSSPPTPSAPSLSQTIPNRNHDQLRDFVLNLRTHFTRHTFDPRHATYNKDTLLALARDITNRSEDIQRNFLAFLFLFPQSVQHVFADHQSRGRLDNFSINL
ncbi:MAG: hypothetical protein VW378_01460 [bacterium]